MKLFRIITILVLPIMVLLCLPQVGFAQDALQCQQTDLISYFPQLPGSAVFLCEPGFASERDYLYVYDSTGDPGLNSYTKMGVNEKVVYFFDASGDGSVNLIISFERTPDNYIASIYDDQDGDHKVSYTIVNGQIAVDESSFWTLKMVSDESWITTSGAVNYNIELLVDGQVNANWLSGQYLQDLSTDGRIDFKIDVKDSNHDGSPDYEIRQSYQPDEYWYLLFLRYGEFTICR